MTPFAFTVPGSPVPWQRARGRGKRRFSSPEQTEYQNAVRWAALAACPPALRAALVKDAKIVWIVALSIVVPDRRRRDADNVQKQIGDALQGVLWLDDSQIVEWHVRRVVDAERPRVEVVTVARSTAPAAWSVSRMIETLAPEARRAA